WKSRSLLPRDDSREPENDPVRDNLVQQLLDHRKQAADELARRRAVEEARFSAVPERESDGAETAAYKPEPGFVSVWDLLQQARELARWLEQDREDRSQWQESFGVEQDDVTVEEMMEYLRNQLAAKNGSMDGIGVLDSQPTASHRSCLFLGMLEMVRSQE